MSTVFKVLPGTDYIPKVGEVVVGVERSLNDFLLEQGIAKLYKPAFTINTEPLYAEPRPWAFFDSFFGRSRTYIKPSSTRTPAVTDPFIWSDIEYGWFTLEGVAGGCDCYIDFHLGAFKESVWSDFSKKAVSSGKFGRALEDMYSIGREWSFRRSAGQPPIIALSYGLLAAQVASLTGGLIATSDGAWDLNDDAVSAEDFLKLYFRPDLPANINFSEWANTCIANIRESN